MLRVQGAVMTARAAAVNATRVVDAGKLFDFLLAVVLIGKQF